MSIKRAKEVLRIEADCIKDLIGKLDNDFVKAVDFIEKSKGRVVITGVGKGGLIGQKISATLSSLGTPSFWLHSTEAIHGDLGRVIQDDVVVVMSNSGETQEVKQLLPILKKLGSKIIAITGNKNSTLAKHADCVLDSSVKKEACSLGLAPTSSTTAMLALGDALAVCVLDRKGFKKEDFAFLHPGGNLGKKLLLKVEDIMRKGKNNPIVKQTQIVKEALYAITAARAGAACVVDAKGCLTGIFTDGDLRRHLEEDSDLSNKKINFVMTKHPITISRDRLAMEALSILRKKKIDELPVVDKNNKPVGILDIQDLLSAGLV
ncbi:MAG: KpsF/GutQ family sugar-phosphate isomerase [Candidatus Gygaella obscura]|nr:KpsF/GutQ family sugar-phosphate isomerase [Candidatus Gygaella obscura]